MYKKVLEKIENIPYSPGCYLYKDAEGNVIYVGKAKSLRKRVRQYFDKSHHIDPKIDILVSQIADIDYVTVSSETEALVLESSLIKKYRPKYNKLQKDDKQYAWIKITNEDIPRILRVREKKRDGAKYFGPFPDGGAARTTLNSLRQIYPYRVCSKRMFYSDVSDKEKYPNDYDGFRFTKNSRLCLDYHLGLCNGPCDNVVSQSEYLQNIQKIEEFLSGKQIGVYSSLNKKMVGYSESKEFEKAASVRDQMNELRYITQKMKVKFGYDEKRLKELKERENIQIANQLFDKLGIQNSSENYRIECYDVSNIQGTNPVTSMVVFENGVPKKSDYRYFRIKSKETPDDYQMMREALERRLKHLAPTTPIRQGRITPPPAGGEKINNDKSFSSKPDLIIVDGGKGQLNMALDVVEDFCLNIPVVGIAKREEEIIKRVRENYSIIRLSKRSKMLHLVQRLRDEAHRFAITRHRNLRSKKMVSSILTDIPGVGSKTVERLIKEFGSLDKIKNQDFESLNNILKNKAKAASIINYFK